MAHIIIDARIINSSTGTYIERLLTYLEQVDTVNRYTVIVPSKDASYWTPKNPQFSIVTADIKNYSFKEQTVFKTFLDSLSPDLVHFCMPQQPLGYTGKKVTTMHDLILLNTYNSDKNWLIFHLKQLVGRYVFKRIARTNDHIIAVSDYTKNAYQAFSGIDSSKISTIYEASDVIDTQTLQQFDHPFSKFILYVGQQSDYKNIRRLGDAHQKLLTSHPDLGLILVGKVNHAAQATKDYFESQGYKNILFTDFIPNEQRDWLYTQAEAYVFPSLMEGFGLPGLEAMGYGTPVISSNATCLPEVYGDAAHYFDPLSVTDITRAVQDVLDTPALRAELIEKGYARRAHYSWKTTASQTHAIYEKVLATTNSPAK